METPTMVLFLLNVHKIPKKLQLEVSKSTILNIRQYGMYKRLTQSQKTESL